MYKLILFVSLFVCSLANAASVYQLQKSKQFVVQIECARSGGSGVIVANNKIFEIAKEENIDKIKADVSITAKPFFEKFGFIEVKKNIVKIAIHIAFHKSLNVSIVNFHSQSHSSVKIFQVFNSLNSIE